MAYEDRIMRMAGSVPQRTVRPNIGFDRAGPARREPATYNRELGRVPTGVTPMGTDPTLFHGRPGMGRMGPPSNRMGPPSNIGYDRMGGTPTGIFGGNQYAANDMVNTMLGGMSTEQERRATGQDPGIDIAQYTDDDKAIQRGLWREANRNVNPEGITPQPLIVKEWERLQEEYWRLKAQGYSPGD